MKYKSGFITKKPKYCNIFTLFSLKTDFSGLLSKQVSGKSRIFNQNQYNPEILY
ncbi:TPA: hypothetical protein JBG74_13755 [Legionella pneumophila]|uniref:Uncharacterized protein n=3 Tax=Legionella pneumophila TaxID=446 RepID=Q5ZY92_LEGPH|nr:hypothetical protein lpg0480 [Legionella pneumophila subsp. pneumophila str. Philadelphia 1]ABQ56765.1 hypothetical protein LPC_2864 [Legionella pneumophila str. Corby]ADG23778.1 hypothetical protein lpa_00736 [Legionella pneumophila 2300/99 Alcoy]AEW50761.1 hypothetical protein lp12_0483 [Legionella pneumophila subsp. pneumophila ATCC 43290]AGH54829.1 hypothetical protein LPE509_02738 [Legionella pneumophila subsp. pneumophila LPE509]AGN13393.1 hypothetical protein LP6_0471 [Legionella pne